MAEGDSKLCFLVGPIGDPDTSERIHADWLLQGVIEPVFKEHFPDFRVERADRITAPGMIDAQVINRLLDAELVIADMSFQNPNAFYEMGIRHLKGLPIIHMFRVGETIPFDVKPHRAIPFKLQHPDDLKKAQQDLKATVAEVIKPGFVVDNPVTRARGIEQISERAMEPVQLLLEEIRELKHRMRMLETKQDFRSAVRGGLAELLRDPAPRWRPPANIALEAMPSSSLATLGSGDALSGERQALVEALLKAEEPPEERDAAYRQALIEALKKAGEPPEKE
jgi:hypothetical protein